MKFYKPDSPKPPTLDIQDAELEKQYLERGWLELPVPPDFDPLTQKPPEWNNDKKQWIAADLTKDEVAAVQLSQKAQSIRDQIDVEISALPKGTVSIYRPLVEDVRSKLIAGDIKGARELVDTAPLPADLDATKADIIGIIDAASSVV